MDSLVIQQRAVRKPKKRGHNLSHREVPDEPQQLQIRRLLASFQFSPEVAATIAAAAFGEAR